MSESKADKIAQVQANLPLPDQPPNASDFNSADARTVNVGSGGVQADFSKGDAASSGLRGGPATGGSAVRSDGSDGGNIAGNTGREVADGLSGLPNDALAGSAKNSAAAVDTTNADKGYPHQNDPAGSFDAKVSGRGNPPTA